MGNYLNIFHLAGGKKMSYLLKTERCVLVKDVYSLYAGPVPLVLLCPNCRPPPPPPNPALIYTKEFKSWGNSPESPFHSYPCSFRDYKWKKGLY